MEMAGKEDKRRSPARDSTAVAGDKIGESPGGAFAKSSAPGQLENNELGTTEIS